MKEAGYNFAIDSDSERDYNQPPEELCLRYTTAYFFSKLHRSLSPSCPSPAALFLDLFE